MGFLWDLVQHSQIREQGERTGSLEGRVAALEHELRETRELLAESLKWLESRFGGDLDGDVTVG